MALSFKYRKEKFRDKIEYYPHIPITLFHKGNQIETTGLLDSGSTHIFIPLELAQALSLEMGKSDYAQTWDGKLPIRESRVGIIIGKGSQTFRKTLPCMVASPTREGPPLVILGRVLFQPFDITFKEKERMTILKVSSERSSYKGKIPK